MGSTFYTRRYKPRVGRNRAKRLKTFSSEDTAQRWASQHGIEKYKLVNLRSDANSTKKIRVVALQ